MRRHRSWAWLLPRQTPIGFTLKAGCDWRLVLLISDVFFRTHTTACRRGACRLGPLGNSVNRELPRIYCDCQKYVAGALGDQRTGNRTIRRSGHSGWERATFVGRSSLRALTSLASVAHT